MNTLFIKRFSRRFINSWLKPRAFIIEYTFIFDKNIPILIAVFYILISSFFQLYITSISPTIIINTYYLLLSFIIYYSVEIILTPLFLLTFLIGLKYNIEFKKDIYLVLYSFSIKIIFTFISFILFIFNSFLNIFSLSFMLSFNEIIFLISTVYFVMLQAYLVAAKNKIRYTPVLMLAISTWLSIIFLLSIIRIFLISVLVISK